MGAPRSPILQLANPPPAREKQRPAKIHYALTRSNAPSTPTAPPPLTQAQRTELRALAALPDTTIDTSDIPLLDDDF
ncbi:MAG: hypothetical protein WDN04_10180 [Rhodospirillales bacterium]